MSEVPVVKKRPRRPNFPYKFKIALVEQSLQPGACVAQIARENGINDNLLFNWRHQYRNGGLLPSGKNMPALLLSCYIQIAIDSYTVVKLALSKRAYKGLSGVPGNRYASFLGEDSPAMNCPYPTSTRNERNALESAYNPL
ncbi:transposase [Salmonella enterica]|nr:transposase [Salmonella enterica]